MYVSSQALAASIQEQTLVTFPLWIRENETLGPGTVGAPQRDLTSREDECQTACSATMTKGEENHLRVIILP